MKNLISCCVIISTLSMAGCIFVSQEATIDPEIAYATSEEGSGISLSVKVNDERPSQALGKRGSFGAEIVTEQDLAGIVKSELEKGFEAKGFGIEEYSSSGLIRIKTELRSLDYSTSAGFFTGGVHVTAALDLEAYKDDKAYENFYRIEKEVRVVVNPGRGQNEKYINEGLSLLLGEVFADSELIAFLTE